MTDSTKVDSGFIYFIFLEEGNYSLQTVLHKGDRDLETANLHSIISKPVQKKIVRATKHRKNDTP